MGGIFDLLEAEENLMIYNNLLSRFGDIEGSAQHIVGRWRDTVSPGSPPSALDDLGLLSCDISLISRYRGLNVPGA